MAKNLFVGSLPFSTTEEALGQLFAQYGQVQSVNVIKDRYSGQSRGFAFVEMATDEESEKAIKELNETEIDGRKIVVNVARPQEDRIGSTGGNQRRDNFSRQNKRW